MVVATSDFKVGYQNQTSGNVLSDSFTENLKKLKSYWRTQTVVVSTGFFVLKKANHMDIVG